MGNYFTSTQILNLNNLSKDEFVENFCKKAEKEGYVKCKEDEGEISYEFAFSENGRCQWVTLSSDAYEAGNEKSERDTAQIAKMLGTMCVNTVVIDSDCAMLSLFDSNGKKADTLVMGRADDYFENDITQPKKTIWEPLIKRDSSWDQFNKIILKEHVFVEDGLSELESVLEMDILKKSENTEVLYLKKACPKITVTQNNKTISASKKLTLNAAFKHVFGEKLAPLGFIRIKSKGFAFGRLINGEILQVVMIVPRKDRDFTSYMIGGGIATVYRGAIDLSVAPEFLFNNWLTITSCYYKDSYPPDYNLKKDCKIGEQTVSKTASNEQIIKTLEISYEYFEKWMLPSFDKVNSINDAVAFFLRYMPWLVSFKNESLKKGTIFDSNESMILTRIEDENELFCKYKEQLEERNEFYRNIGKPDSQFDILQKTEELRQTISVLKSDEKYFIKGEENKRANMDVLRSLGYGK